MSWEVWASGISEEGWDTHHELTSSDLEEVLQMVRTCLTGGIRLDLADGASVEASNHSERYSEVVIKEMVKE